MFERLHKIKNIPYRREGMRGRMFSLDSDNDALFDTISVHWGLIIQAKQREDDVKKKLHVSRFTAHLVAIGALLACVSSANAQTTVKIGLAVPNYGPFAPVYAADELGY